MVKLNCKYNINKEDNDVDSWLASKVSTGVSSFLAARVSDRSSHVSDVYESSHQV